MKRGRDAMIRAPDCLASHVCIPVSNPAVLVWGFQRSNIVSPFSMWLGDHVIGGLIELRLTPVYRRQFRAGPRTARSSHIEFLEMLTKRFLNRKKSWSAGYTIQLNPLTAKLFNLNFHSLEVVSRWRDPQLQVSENYSDLTKWRSTLFKSCWLMSHFILNIFKMWYLMC